MSKTGKYALDIDSGSGETLPGQGGDRGEVRHG